MKQSNRHLNMFFSIIPGVQVLIVFIHAGVDLNHSNSVTNILLMSVSLILATINMIHFMSENKTKQLQTFQIDSSKEEVMVAKIEKSKFQTKIEAAKDDDDISYESFLNLYFSCFRHQPIQQILITLNWGASLFVILYLMYPLIGIGINGGVLVISLFSLLLISLFTVTTYFYALYLKTKVEAQIIEDYVHRHHL